MFFYLELDQINHRFVESPLLAPMFNEVWKISCSVVWKCSIASSPFPPPYIIYCDKFHDPHSFYIFHGHSWRRSVVNIQSGLYVKNGLFVFKLKMVGHLNT